MELQIRKTNFDPVEVVRLALDKQNWGKKYTLYTYGRTTITAEMDRFYFNKQLAVIEVRVENPNLKTWWTNVSLYIDYNNEIFDFKKYLLKRIISLLGITQWHETEYLAKKAFSNLERPRYQITDKDIIEAGFRDVLNAINKLPEEIKKKQYSKLVDTVEEILNKDFNKAVEDEIENHPVNIEGFKEIREDIEKQLKGDE